MLFVPVSGVPNSTSITTNTSQLASDFHPSAALPRSVEFENPIAIRDVKSLYAYGNRCPLMVRCIALYPSLHLPLNICQHLATIIFNWWELDNNGLLTIPTRSRHPDSHSSINNNHSNSKNSEAYDARLYKFVTYFMTFIQRTRPHAFSLLLAMSLVYKLKTLHPRAKGEPGCAHRLFVVSLMLAMRYIELDHDLITSYGYTNDSTRMNSSIENRNTPSFQFFITDGSQNIDTLLDKPLPLYELESTECWARLSHPLFSPSDLHKMESEMVTFLKYDLYIEVNDLIGWTERELLCKHTPFTMNERLVNRNEEENECRVEEWIKRMCTPSPPSIPLVDR